MDRTPRDSVDADLAKLLRLRWMVAAILEELRSVSPDPAVTERAADLARRVVIEVGSAVPESELGELGELVGELGGGLSLGEARVLDAQLVGWLEGMAMASELDAVRAEVAAEQQQVRSLQAEATLEARRQARSIL